MSHVVTITINQQQRAIVGRLREHLGSDLPEEEVVRQAYVWFSQGQATRPRREPAPGDEVAQEAVDLDGTSSDGTDSREAGTGVQVPRPSQKLAYGEVREDVVLEPVSGLAMPVHKGEVLRITQEEDGGQCVDFNAFSLQDYKEYMSVGRTRAYNGIFPTKGGLIYSTSPRDRVMFEIEEMPSSCRAETIGARCNAVLFERALGVDLHTNCQDTIAECIGEYGLTPDDVHDSFNLWMNTDIDATGHTHLRANTGRRGDYVDLLAAFDTLSVPVICGSGDVFLTSNFRLKRVRVQVYAASDDTGTRAEFLHRRYNCFKHNRTPRDFRVSEIQTQRVLRRTPDYSARFVQFPLKYHQIAVTLADDEYRELERIRESGDVPGVTDEELVRACVMLCYLRMTSKESASIESVFAEVETAPNMAREEPGRR